MSIGKPCVSLMPGQRSGARSSVKKSTVNREFNVLETMLGKAIEWKLLDANPARAVKRFKMQDAGYTTLSPPNLAGSSTRPDRTSGRRGLSRR